MSLIQPAQDLERSYSVPDPWNYEGNPDDMRRKTELLSLLPSRRWSRTLDIGCGNGFITFDLPGARVTGVDVSAAAVSWAKKARESRADAARFDFCCHSIFDLDRVGLGVFDLVVITGVLYPQYIGKASSVVALKLDAMLAQGGVLASCHINEWKPPRFAYASLDTIFYPYREHTHRLEVYRK